MHDAGMDNGKKAIALAMQTRGASPFIAGDLSLADLYLAPIAFYLSLTPDMPNLLAIEGFADWWARIQALKSFEETPPA